MAFLIKEKLRVIFEPELLRLGKNQKSQRYLIYLLLILGFLLIWCILTLIILFTQETVNFYLNFLFFRKIFIFSNKHSSNQYLIQLLVAFQKDGVTNAEEINLKYLQNVNKGLQVIVGHYNGNLPAEQLNNLTNGFIFNL